MDYLWIFWSNLARMGWLILPWGAIYEPPGVSVCGYDEELEREWCS